MTTIPIIALQSVSTPISCLPYQNSSVIGRLPNFDFIHDTCLDDIKGSDDNDIGKILILDEYFGWFLAIEIMLLMGISKICARDEKSKQICWRFTELLNEFQNPEGVYEL